MPHQQNRARKTVRRVDHVSPRGGWDLDIDSACGHPIIVAVDSQNRRIAEQVVVDPSQYDAAVAALWALLDELEPPDRLATRRARRRHLSLI